VSRRVRYGEARLGRQRQRGVRQRVNWKTSVGDVGSQRRDYCNATARQLRIEGKAFGKSGRDSENRAKGA
jgi:hypothetical protein